MICIVNIGFIGIHVLSRTTNVHLPKSLTDDTAFAQEELKDDKYIHSSRLYNLLNDQLQHWHAEAERYKALTDSLQVFATFWILLSSFLVPFVVFLKV